MIDLKMFLTLTSILISLSLVSVECNLINQNDVLLSSRPQQSSGRALSFWPFNKGLSRQIYDMIDIVTDVAMLTFLGIPFLGLVALGASVIAPSALGKTTIGNRNKRSSDTGLTILGRSKRALLYARNLFDILANLEETFRKYEIIESECQLKAVCEVHKYKSIANKYSTFGTEITNLIRMENELEEYEIIPLARIIFNQYTDAATYGNEDNDCDLIYSRCSHKLEDSLQKHTIRH